MIVDGQMLPTARHHLRGIFGEGAMPDQKWDQGTVHMMRQGFLRPVQLKKNTLRLGFLGDFNMDDTWSRVLLLILSYQTWVIIAVQLPTATLW